MVPSPSAISKHSMPLTLSTSHLAQMNDPLYSIPHSFLKIFLNFFQSLSFPQSYGYLLLCGRCWETQLNNVL